MVDDLLDGRWHMDLSLNTTAHAFTCTQGKDQKLLMPHFRETFAKKMFDCNYAVAAKWLSRVL